VAAARAALGLFVRTASVDLPRLDEAGVDGRVLMFAFLLTLVCGLLFGLLPAWRLSRIDPQAVLRSETHTVGGSRGGLRLREWLVGGEVALGTLLLVLAGLLVSSLWHVLRVERGFAGSALDVAVNLPGRYQAPKDRANFFDLAVERLRALPGVSTVAVASRVPLTGESNVNNVNPQGKSAAPLDGRTIQLVMVNIRFVSQDYFAALGIPLRRGRAIEAADRERNVAVISERLAAKLWPGEDPLGRVLSTSGSGIKNPEVVGVVGDVHTSQLERDPTLMFYVPFWKQPWQVAHLVVRGARVSPEEVRRTIQAIDPGIPAPKMRTMDEIGGESVAQRRFQMRVAAAFAVSALLLAALGIYGVVAYGVTLRRRELGIRMALGARAGEVRRLVVRQGLRPVMLGLGFGMLAALGAGRLVRTLLFGVSPTDGWTLSAVAAGLALVAALACLMPAHSASRIDPGRVLREE
jgi:putative ABC transport system permease protein